MVQLLAILIFWTVQPSNPSISNDPPTLKAELQSYFGASKPEERARISSLIKKTFGFEAVKNELQILDLWTVRDNVRPAAQRTHDIALPSGRRVQVAMAISTDVTNQPSTVILEFVDNPRQGAAAAQTGIGLDATWVTISPLVGGTFHLPPNEASDMPALMREIRSRIRVDSNRVFLFGERDGADAAWITALMYPRYFAGLIVIDGGPHVPYPEQSLALLLPNLRNVPFLSIWTDDAPAQTPSSVSALNKAIADFAARAGMVFETATIAPTGGAIMIPSKLIASAITRQRTVPTSVSHWFRYLPQGNAGWLRATDLAGDVWEHEQFSIAVTSKEDRDAFIIETLKEKLFYIGGTIEGQSITVETKRIGAIELRLSLEQVDFSKAVTITVNGRQRFEGMLEPSITDLLECAYEDWDFQHPVYVRKSFTINAR